MEPPGFRPARPETGKICLNCGSALHDTALGPACPACLMAQVMAGPGRDPPQEARIFGGYELLQELGRGGVASVYRARDLKLERIVALKMLLAGPFAGSQANDRFAREMKVVAQLRHPGIVALYEAGEHEGIRFFTMELVDGRTLAEMVGDSPLAPRRAAEYVRKAAEAVDYAHGHGICHCDLKPANVLIDGFDQPKVADFGIARLQVDEAEGTGAAGVAGSPAYMAPEQADGLDTSAATTDVYGLGAILYHLLTGRAPHGGARIADVVKSVRELPVLGLKTIDPSIPGDLESICLKCLQKDPSKRYAPARDLAQDLARFERGEPVRACPVGWWGRGWRWTRRKPALAAALLALALLVIAGCTAVLRQAVRNRHERIRLEIENYASGMEAASLAAAEGDFSGARSYLTALQPQPDRVDRRGFEWRLLWGSTGSEAIQILHPHRQAVAQLAFSPDGRGIATNSFDGTTKWLTADTFLAAPFASGHGGGWALAFTPDRSTCYVGSEGRVRLEQVSTGATLWAVPGWKASLSFDGRRLAVALGSPLPWSPANGAVEIWDTFRRRPLTTIEGDYRAVAISPNGHLVAVAPGDSSIRVHDVETGRQLAMLATDVPQTAVAFSADGRLIASCGQGEARLWRANDGALIARLPHPWLRVWALAFSPSGGILATTCSDRAVRIWDTADGKCLATLRGHSDEVWSVAFAADGETLASGGKDGSVLLWRARRPASHAQRLSHHGWSRPLFSPDGTGVAVTEAGAVPHVMLHWEGGADQTGPIGWSACGSAREGTRLLLWSTDPERPLRWWDAKQSAFAGSFDGAETIEKHLLAETGCSPDGRRVFQMRRNGVLTVWNAGGGVPIRKYKLVADSSKLRSVALSPRGRWFAWSTLDGEDCWLADLESGSVRALSGHRNEVNSLAFDPAGDELATASSDGTVRLWRCASGLAEAVLSGHLESVDDVAFSSDGRTLASLGTLQSLKFWNLATGRCVLTVPMPDAGSYLAFSRDDRQLAVTIADVASGADGGVRLMTAP